MSKPAKPQKAKRPVTVMTKDELKKRAHDEVVSQPAAKRTRNHCKTGHVKAVLRIPAVPPKFQLGDTWVNEHHQLLRIVTITKPRDILDSRFAGSKSRVFIIEITDGKVPLQFCLEEHFTPENWGWQRIATPLVVKTPSVWRHLN